MKIKKELLAPLNARFEGLDALEILRRVHAVFGKRAAILSSMQMGGGALAHMADQAGLDFDVVFVDTGVLHQETLATRDRLAATHRHLRVVTLAPQRSFADQTRDEGLLYLSKEGQERCCDLRKSEPLRHVRGHYDAFIAALSRGEGKRRAKLDVFEVDPDNGVVRIHPLLGVSKATLGQYADEHPDMALNPLHAMGFPSIGCFPCTTPVRPDEDERAGRWRHLADVAYCGINPTDTGRTGDIELDDRYATFLAPA